MLARLGLYKEAPPLPSVIGYEVVVKVIKTGSEGENVSVGDRVTAFTRFGGYSGNMVITKGHCWLVKIGGWI